MNKNNSARAAYFLLLFASLLFVVERAGVP